MNSRAPISGLDRPVPGQPRDLGLLGGQRLTAPAVRAPGRCACGRSPRWPRSSRRARSANASMPIAVQHPVGGTQLLPRLDPAALAAQPLPVEQVRRGPARRGPGSGPAARSTPGTSGRRLRSSLSRARTRASIPSAHSVGVARVRSDSQSSAARTGATSPVLAAASASSGTTSGRAASWSRWNACQAASRAASCRPRPLCSTALAHDRAMSTSLPSAACGRLLGGGLDQLGGLLLPAAPGREHHRGIRNRRVPGRLRDQAIFFDQPLPLWQLAGEKVDSGELAERELQVYEGAGVAGELNLAGGQGMPGLEVPQLEGDDAAHSRRRSHSQRPTSPSADVQGEKQLERPGQRRRGRCVPLRVPAARTRRAGRRPHAAARDRAARRARPRPPPARRRGCRDRRPTSRPRAPPGASRGPGRRRAARGAGPR